MEAMDLLIRPVVTEASTQMMAEGKYTFQVALRATKPEIAKAVEKLFQVKVKKVHTMRVPGKLRRQGRTAGYRPDWKKAIVTLAEGQSITLFEGV